MSVDNVVIGQHLCNAAENVIKGEGTYELKGAIYAAVSGHKSMLRASDNKMCVSVRNDHKLITITANDLVVAKVTSANSRFCKCAIFIVINNSLREPYHLHEPFHAIIRREDIRATDKDKVLVHNSFRCGDILLARVISLGDAQAYVLSTAENELGVVSAISEAGAELIPLSWCQMQCPLTLNKEYRKVAKVQPEFLTEAQQI